MAQPYFLTAWEREDYEREQRGEKPQGPGKMDAKDAEIKRLRVALFMCAAHFQGGHSDAGAITADELRVPFPITMDALVDRAQQEGLDPDGLWPWLKKMRTMRRNT